jgi:hypothetical protein
MVFQWLFSTFVEWAATYPGMFATFLVNVFCMRRTYRCTSGYNKTLEVLDALILMKALRFGGEPYNNRMAPLLLLAVHPPLIAYTSISHTSMTGNAILTIDVIWPRWAKPPFKVDVQPPQVKTANMISVLQCTSNRDENAHELEEVHELVYPRRGISEQAIQDATTVATAIVDVYKRNECVSAVYVLHGQPGVGKTTAVRILAHMLDAILYADYNPTTPTDNLLGLSSTYAGSDQTMVIAYEECDVTFAKIAAGNIRRPDDYRPDAIDKGSWNRVIDTFKRRTNVILVMTTNATYDELSAMADPAHSMLREGRVDAHFVWVPGTTVVMVDPIRPCQPVEEVDSSVISRSSSSVVSGSRSRSCSVSSRSTTRASSSVVSGSRSSVSCRSTKRAPWR